MASNTAYHDLSNPFGGDEMDVDEENVGEVLTWSNLSKHKQKSHRIFSCLEFFPAGIYDRLLTEAVVRDQLNLGPDGHNDLVKFIMKEGRKVALTALEILTLGHSMGFIPANSLPEITCGKLKQFWQNGFTDARLPVDETSANSILEFTEWYDQAKTTFCKNQWAHLAPIFSKDNFSFKFDERQPLPFTKLGNHSSRGNSSVVYEVGIHTDHLIDPPLDCDGNPRSIAIKKIEVGAGGEPGHSQIQFDPDAETRALESIRNLKHPHLIQWIAAFTRGTSDYYLMFPWADGGSLRNFWQHGEVEPMSLNVTDMRRLVRDTTLQFRGLADALMRLHVDLKYRHGDIKPENILRFKDRETMTGNLQIADFGLAKQHNSPTVQRGATTTRHTTLQYESPEAEVAMKGGGGFSRLSDIWSLGCVLLQHLIWLVYGRAAVETFNDELKAKDQHGHQQYFWRKAGGGAAVHPTVVQWINHMKAIDGITHTAIGKLLSVVQGNLLVTDSRDNWEDAGTSCTPQALAPGVRASAKELLFRLNDIVRSLSDENLLFPGYAETSGQHRSLWLSNGLRKRLELPSDGFPGRRPSGSHLSIGQDRLSPVAAQLSRKTPGIGQIPTVINPPVPEKMNKTWNYTIDRAVLGSLDPSLPEPASLCGDCTKLDFAAMGFQISYPVSHLRRQEAKCGLCKILWNSVWTKLGGEVQAASHFGAKLVKFERVHSTLRIQDDHEPALSIIASPALKERNPGALAGGFAKLPPQGSDTHFGIIRQWLSSCDASHPDCNPGLGRPGPGRSPRKPSLPTRLLDVGEPSSLSILLVEKHDPEFPAISPELLASPSTYQSPYIALSHPWGSPPFFCTYPDPPPGDANPFGGNTPRTAAATTSGIKNTLTTHRTKGIPITSLPQTFHDAVLITRALGKRYLWIDSLCILQGPRGDFKDEAEKMEEVFSDSYVVIAASSARDQRSGILTTERRDREVVTVVGRDSGGQPTPAVYVCEMIDKFEDDVLNSHLNSRAWVLQERALARRTVYFTGRQTYWECGKGVRCETGTVMTNQLASFLGDPSFPAVGFSGNRGQEIRWFQELYSQYSRLGLSHEHDRPIAICGLETRLTAAFAEKYSPVEAEGGRPAAFIGRYGVLSDGLKGGLLHRSLLWCRGDSSSKTSRTSSTLRKKTKSGPHPTPTNRKRIYFPPGYDDIPPSWSWMSYNGGIDYIGIQGGTVEWMPLDLRFPSTDVEVPSGSPTTYVPRAGAWGYASAIIATAHDFDLFPRKCPAPPDSKDHAREPDFPEERIIFDIPTMTMPTGNVFKCVVVGKERVGGGIRDRSDIMCFVIIVTRDPNAPTKNSYQTSTGEYKDMEAYRRVGVGSIVSRCIISFEGEGEQIAII